MNAGRGTELVVVGIESYPSRGVLRVHVAPDPAVHGVQTREAVQTLTIDADIVRQIREHVRAILPDA